MRRTAQQLHSSSLLSCGYKLLLTRPLPVRYPTAFNSIGVYVTRECHLHQVHYLHQFYRKNSWSDSFRSSSPTHSIQIEHQIPNHPHLHIHTIRSSVTSSNNNNNNENAIYDDDVSPPSSISAQILAPFLNAPVPSTFKSASSPGPTSTATNGHQSRGASARASALGSLSRSSSYKRNSRRRNEDNSLTAEYLELIGDGRSGFGTIG